MGSITHLCAKIALPRPLLEPLSYLVPDEIAGKLTVGSCVTVPFQKSSTSLGYVVKLEEITQEAMDGLSYKLKYVKACEGTSSFFDEATLPWFQWIADYYQASLGEVLQTAFPKTLLETSKRKLKAAAEGLTQETPSADPQPSPKISYGTNFELTPDQKAALLKIDESLEGKLAKNFLLFGVTGSGKTEIYLRAAEHALMRGEQALILVPEIALTPQLRERFMERFGNVVAVLHSSLTPGQRRSEWWEIRAGRRSIVVGARSAVFAPLSKIGLIVVDEEHDGSYKQEDHLRYHARDIALVRAKLNKATVILGSATPALETFQNARLGKFELLALNSRPGHRLLPHITLVDLRIKSAPEDKRRKKPPFSFISPLLKQRLEETLMSGHQAMIFLNRKGYSSSLLCRECGFIPQCNHCSISLTFYMKSAALRCHYCGYQTHAPDTCPSCHSLEFKFLGLGTESVEQDLKRLYPEAKIERMDAESITNIKKLEDLLTRFRNQEIQVLVGTQMLAKGHDFPNVTLIGILLAEMGLHFPDFRAAEKTFQLLSQVAGRAGRGDHPGEVILQTHLPDHYAIQSALAQDYVAFFEKEIQLRQECCYPPFSRLVQIEFRHKKDAEAQNQAQEVIELLRRLGVLDAKSVEILGPTPGTVFKIAGEYRWQLLMKAEKITLLNSVLRSLRKNLQKSNARFIDVDPMNTL